MRKTLIVLSILFLYGCGATLRNFVRSGTEIYQPKPEDYDVLVFFKGDRPTKEFEVIGMVYAEKEANTGIRWDVVKPEKVIELLKEIARKQGADAIIDVKIISAEFRKRDWKRGEAKAIIFKNNNITPSMSIKTLLKHNGIKEIKGGVAPQRD